MTLFKRKATTNEKIHSHLHSKEKKTLANL